MESKYSEKTRAISSKQPSCFLFEGSIFGFFHFHGTLGSNLSFWNTHWIVRLECWELLRCFYLCDVAKRCIKPGQPFGEMPYVLVGHCSHVVCFATCRVCWSFRDTGILQWCEKFEEYSFPPASCNYFDILPDYLKNLVIMMMGPGERSRYSDLLRTGRSGDRIPVEARFSTPVQTDLEPFQPPIQWVPGLSPGVRRPGPGVDHPPI
jgi:hypothetical protein